MKSCLKYLVLLFCLTLIEGSFRCDYKYSSTAKGWLKLFVVPVTWFDARLRCSLEGAALMSPTTRELKHKMMHILQDSPLKQDIFTGIHATLSKGYYHTVDVSWAEYEPDNKDNKENCLTFNSNGELADNSCGETRPYICYRPENPQVEVNECGAVDPEYHLDNRTNKCYKFHLVPRNFSRASLACSAEGGHLAIINSAIEAKILSEIFSEISRSGMFGMSPIAKEVAFIGFFDWGECGDWRTIYGQTLLEAGFSKFDPLESNNLTPGEYCGSIYRSGLLKGLRCDKAFTFICEKSPDYPAVCHVDNQST